jgi:hypothetical protein
MSADLELVCSGTYSEARPNAREVPVSFEVSISVERKQVTISSSGVPNLGLMGVAHAVLTRADRTEFVFETSEKSKTNPRLVRLVGVISRTDGTASIGMADNPGIFGGDCKPKAQRF